jgi:outer membrane biosynthesis protein TonB
MPMRCHSRVLFPVVVVLAAACTRSTTVPPSPPAAEVEAPPSEVEAPPSEVEAPPSEAEPPPSEAEPPPSDEPPTTDEPPTHLASEGAAMIIPMVTQAKAVVQGPFDKDILRRIVRAHINEIRFCYNQELKANPELKGRISVRFAIEADGTVAESRLVKTEPKTDAMRAVGDCAANAIPRWLFPKPSGGERVLVTYPFLLEPGRSE